MEELALFPGVTASLARLLARSGMMREVADFHDQVHKQFAPPTQWQRLAAFLRMNY